MDNTLIYVIIGDNGASGEGTLKGTFNEMMVFNGMADIIETPEYLASRLEAWGGPEGMPHYAVGWAWAMDTPYQWTKQVASHWGGTRQRHHRALAQGHSGKRRTALPVQPCE